MGSLCGTEQPGETRECRSAGGVQPGPLRLPARHGALCFAGTTAPAAQRRPHRGLPAACHAAARGAEGDGRPCGGATVSGRGLVRGGIRHRRPAAHGAVQRHRDRRLGGGGSGTADGEPVPVRPGSGTRGRTVAVPLRIDDAGRLGLHGPGLPAVRAGRGAQHGTCAGRDAGARGPQSGPAGPHAAGRCGHAHPPQRSLAGLHRAAALAPARSAQQGRGRRCVRPVRLRRAAVRGRHAAVGTQERRRGPGLAGEGQRGRPWAGRLARLGGHHGGGRVLRRRHAARPAPPYPRRRARHRTAGPAGHGAVPP